MFTRQVRNIFVVLFMIFSIVLVPTVSAEVVVESNGMFPDIIVEPNGMFPDIIVEPNGMYPDTIVEPNGLTDGST